MGKAPRLKVHYGEIPVADRKNLIVERLNRDRVDLNMGRAVQDVLHSAYSSAYERVGFLPEGATKRNFSSNPLQVRRRVQRMRQHMRDSSQYWIARDPAEDHRLIGLAKVTPEEDGLYVNDIVVQESNQRNGIGRALAHAALKHQRAVLLGEPVTLDAVHQGVVNHWYEQEWGLSLEPNGEINAHGIPFGEDSLGTVRYISPEGVTLGGIIAAMEERDPRLKTDVVTGPRLIESDA
jgi:GNAT superfamily N-acetyltransferase